MLYPTGMPDVFLFFYVERLLRNACSLPSCPPSPWNSHIRIGSVEEGSPELDVVMVVPQDGLIEYGCRPSEKGSMEPKGPMVFEVIWGHPKVIT